MGKATGLSSQFRGKVGNVVGYLTKNRAGRYEQTVKGYQPVVANPQSYAQALARVPVGPVQRICSALLPLIQRGFEGTAYGDASKNEYLSYNLKYFRGPYMPKGTVAVPPGPMLISKGSLKPITVYGFDGNADSELISFSLVLRTSFTSHTFGDLSAHLLQFNEFLVQGEQLTFILVDNESGTYNYYMQSFFLDPNNETELNGIFAGVAGVNNKMTFSQEEGGILGYFVAGACIRSQPYGDSSFRRSTAILGCNPAAELYNDAAAVQNAVASYRDGEESEDWEDDPTPEYQKIAYLCMVTITQDMCMYTSWAEVQGHKCLGYVTKGGEIGIFYAYSNQYSAYCLLDEKAKPINFTTGGSNWAVRYNGTYQPAREYSSVYGTM